MKGKSLKSRNEWCKRVNVNVPIIPASFGVKKIKKVFGEFGEIERVKIGFSVAMNSNYCVITFKEEDSARRLLEEGFIEAGDGPLIEVMEYCVGKGVQGKNWRRAGEGPARGLKRGLELEGRAVVPGDEFRKGLEVEDNRSSQENSGGSYESRNLTRSPRKARVEQRGPFGGPEKALPRNHPTAHNLVDKLGWGGEEDRDEPGHYRVLPKNQDSSEKGLKNKKSLKIEKQRNTGNTGDSSHPDSEIEIKQPRWMDYWKNYPKDGSERIQKRSSALVVEFRQPTKNSIPATKEGFNLRRKRSNSQEEFSDETLNHFDHSPNDYQTNQGFNHYSEPFYHSDEEEEPAGYSREYQRHKNDEYFQEDYKDDYYPPQDNEWYQNNEEEDDYYYQEECLQDDFNPERHKEGQFYEQEDYLNVYRGEQGEGFLDEYRGPELRSRRFPPDYYKPRPSSPDNCYRDFKKRGLGDEEEANAFFDRNRHHEHAGGYDGFYDTRLRFNLVQNQYFEGSRKFKNLTEKNFNKNGEKGGNHLLNRRNTGQKAPFNNRVDPWHQTNSYTNFERLNKIGAGGKQELNQRELRGPESSINQSLNHILKDDRQNAKETYYGHFCPSSKTAGRYAPKRHQGLSSRCQRIGNSFEDINESPF